VRTIGELATGVAHVLVVPGSVGSAVLDESLADIALRDGVAVLADLALDVQGFTVGAIGAVLGRFGQNWASNKQWG
jgi:hypothetical protein